MLSSRSASRSSGGLLGLAALGLLLIGVACSADPAADGSSSSGGPPNPTGKPEGSECKDGDDCQSLTCKAGKCTPVVSGGNPTDNKKNGDETDVDCGGSSAPKCEEGKACETGDDCETASCIKSVCKAPAPDDGVKNADETDVDCGGTVAPKCELGKICAKNDDCSKDSCSYDKKCIEFPSCTAHFGGDTCGSGETGDAEAKHESCCTTITSTGIKVNKYAITAGRMRAFIERFGGNLKQWAATNPSGWNDGWNDELPGDLDEANEKMGPAGKRGCQISTSGGGSRTYFTTHETQYSQDVLDEKTLNCVPWVMVQALCHFDGGRLMSQTELRSLRTNGGASKWPWGDTPNFVFKSSGNPVNHTYNYQRPENETEDQSRFVSPPGRFPDGANADGVQDILGNVMPFLNDDVNLFGWTGSWEDSHPVTNAGKETQVWPNENGTGPERNGYWAIGGRCVFDN